MKKKKKNKNENISNYLNIATMVCLAIFAIMIYFCVHTSNINYARTYSLFCCLSLIAAIAIAAYTSNKFPNNIFSKILIWMFIVIGIIISGFVIYGLISCVVACQGMPG